MKRSLVKKPRQQKARGPKSTAELLFEIGMEELPFEFVAPALTALRESASLVFQDARLSFGSVKTYGTPGGLSWGAIPRDEVLPMLQGLKA